MSRYRLDVLVPCERGEGHLLAIEGDAGRWDWPYVRRVSLVWRGRKRELTPDKLNPATRWLLEDALGDAWTAECLEREQETADIAIDLRREQC